MANYGDLTFWAKSRLFSGFLGGPRNSLKIGDLCLLGINANNRDYWAIAYRDGLKPKGHKDKAVAYYDGFLAFWAKIGVFGQGAKNAQKWAKKGF